MCINYNLTKFSFANRIVSIWYCLPDYVVSACSVGVFEKRLDFSAETKIACTIGEPLELESEIEV